MTNQCSVISSEQCRRSAIVSTHTGAYILCEVHCQLVLNGIHKFIRFLHSELLLRSLLFESKIVGHEYVSYEIVPEFVAITILLSCNELNKTIYGYISYEIVQE